MGMGVFYRRPAESDLQAMTDIINRSSRGLKAHTDSSPEEIRLVTFADDQYDPNGYLLAFSDGTPVGYGGAMVDAKRLASGFDDGYIGVFVVPEARGAGIEDRLVRSAIRYLRSRGIGAARMLAYEACDWRNGLAAKHGMGIVRHGYLMKHDGAAKPAPSPLPPGHRLEPMMMADMSNEQLAIFTDAVNDAFSEHWNFAPMRADRFIRIRDVDAGLRTSEFRIALSWSGGEVSGLCYSEISAKRNEQHGEMTGWINILGVRKPYRRSGLGRALLSETMAWLRERGMDSMYLGVDGENERALGLYKSLGFRVDGESTTYELRL